MKKYKGFWVCEIDADNFSTSSYFGDGEGFPTVGHDIEAESVEEAEKKICQSIIKNIRNHISSF